MSLQIEAFFSNEQLQYIVDAILEKLNHKMTSMSEELIGQMRNEVMTVNEVAQKLKVNQYTVRNWIKSKKLNAEMSGKKYQIRVEELDNYLKRNNRYKN
jgi:excisionase family DNA binding protein